MGGIVAAVIVDGMSDIRLSSTETAEPHPSYPTDRLAQVCGEVAAVFRRAWGRGPIRTTANWAGPNMLVVLLENGHTDAEKTLRAAGYIQELLGGRHLLQVLIEDDLKASVERILERPVEAMLSATRLDPDLSAEIFLLGHNRAQDTRANGSSALKGRAEEAHARAQELGAQAEALTAQHRQTRRRAQQRREH